ncbi:MAG: pyridoxal phosphate-dependent aminotransferase [Nitrososphaerales archaeon]
MSAVQPQSAREEESVPAVSIVDIFLRARELERKGHDVIHFDAGEPDFGPPEQVVDATIRALREGRGRYTESAGIPQAKNAISQKLERKYSLKISPGQILVTSGGRIALYFSYAILPKGSKIGIISPDWPAYRNLSQFMSYKTQFFRTRLEDGWSIDPDEVKKSDCNALVLNYPNNPTGKILDPRTFDELVQIAREKNMVLISDEVYSDYILDGSNRFKSVLEVTDLRYVLVTSLSKSYSMTGFRAGYIVSDDKTTAQLSKLNSLIMTSVPEFVQYAIIAAMECDDYVKEKVNLIRKRRDVATRALKKYLSAELYLPDGSLYVFPKLHSPRGAFNSEQFAIEALEKQFVSVTPGTSFGNSFSEYIRITLLQSETRIEEGIMRMANALR